MSEKSLEERIQRLEDIEAIKQLKVRYSHICDDDHNPDDIASLFVEDEIWESPMPSPIIIIIFGFFEL